MTTTQNSGYTIVPCEDAKHSSLVCFINMFCIVNSIKNELKNKFFNILGILLVDMLNF